MANMIRNIVIVGGGSAGWLTAALLAAEHNVDQKQLAKQPKLQITLIESPDVPTIGVGEGSWPSMRSTLQKIGISETTFLIECDASFKQGSKFIGWRGAAAYGANAAQPDQYLHPFSLPIGQPDLDLCRFWLPFQQEVSFAEAVTQQYQLCELGLAPKQISTAEFSFINNYGYHFNAGKFSQLLQRHCTSQLGVVHISDHVSAVLQRDNGDIDSLQTAKHGLIQGDLFIDCSGSKALLIGETLKVPFINQQPVLFNDRALACAVDYPSHDAPIASCTLSTAQPSGWVWDIGLPARRGVGLVYSSAHTSADAAAASLLAYITQSGGRVNPADFRPIQFAPGHRARCFQNNCLAIGMAAGFIEPLEASALALVEWTAKALAKQLPANRAVLDIVAKRINRDFARHWQQIIEFLKLHYVLSQRQDHAYWQDHRDAATIPDSLKELLQLWCYQVPGAADIDHADQLFPYASYQFVLYGMGFQTQIETQFKPSLLQQAQILFKDNQQRCQAMRQALSPNRQLLDKIKQQGLPSI